jgi:hypothetical protein
MSQYSVKFRLYCKSLESRMDDNTKHSTRSGGVQSGENDAGFRQLLVTGEPPVVARMEIPELKIGKFLVVIVGIAREAT